MISNLRNGRGSLKSLAGCVASPVSLNCVLICLLAFCVSLLVSRNRTNIGGVIDRERSLASDDHTERLQLVANHRGSRIDSEDLAPLSACERLFHADSAAVICGSEHERRMTQPVEIQSE